MFSSRINFPMISKALSLSMEALQNEKQPSILAMKKIKKAQDELQQALSFAMAENLDSKIIQKICPEI